MKWKKDILQKDRKIFKHQSFLSTIFSDLFVLLLSILRKIIFTLWNAEFSTFEKKVTRFVVLFYITSLPLFRFQCQKQANVENKNTINK